jgi:hypothetical protein
MVRKAQGTEQVDEIKKYFILQFTNALSSAGI